MVIVRLMEKAIMLLHCHPDGYAKAKGAGTSDTKVETISKESDRRLLLETGGGEPQSILQNQDRRSESKEETDKLYSESIPGEREEPCMYTTIYVHTPMQPSRPARISDRTRISIIDSLFLVFKCANINVRRGLPPLVLTLVHLGMMMGSHNSKRRMKPFETKSPLRKRRRKISVAFTGCIPYLRSRASIGFKPAFLAWPSGKKKRSFNLSNSAREGVPVLDSFFARA
ncbi:unnamed protein product [Vicia faba]|uniref:Uncharacterized protein n=1 Tax=Vicia faba TaxID=3906 RepID=A0AAV1ANM0_VICFA|nr:unnamed protein product [Vicia faba]